MVSVNCNPIAGDCRITVNIYSVIKIAIKIIIQLLYVHSILLAAF